MKTLNINTKDGFTVKIEAIHFSRYESDSNGEDENGFWHENPDTYVANVAVKCGNTGVVIICLSGDENESSAKWPIGDVLWSEEDRNFQEYIESEYSPAEFLKRLEDECDLENNMFYLEENGESMN